MLPSSRSAFGTGLETFSLLRHKTLPSLSVGAPVREKSRHAVNVAAACNEPHAPHRRTLAPLQATFRQVYTTLYQNLYPKCFCPGATPARQRKQWPTVLLLRRSFLTPCCGHRGPRVDPRLQG